MTEKKPTEYEKLGVSAKKDDVTVAAKAAAKKRQGKAREDLFPGTFTPIFPLPFDNGKCIVPHADGAGSEPSLAYLYWKETGDISAFKKVVFDSIIMNLDDVLCVGGESGHMSVISHISRNALTIPTEVLAALFEASEELFDILHPYGIDIRGGVGETADVGDTVRTLTVDHSLIAVMDKKDVINNANIKAGDLIVGLSSFGKATYETEYNSGMGSNGLTLARHGLLSNEYASKYPESFNPAVIDVAYRGKFKVTDKIKAETGEEITVGNLILSPTRTYAPVMKKIFSEIKRSDIHGIVHCSGGGQTKILKCIPEGVKVIKDNMMPVPVLFETIQEQTGASDHEMYEDFNMGARFDICVSSKEIADKVIAIAKSFNIDAQVVGRIEVSDKKSVEIVRKGFEPLVYPKRGSDFPFFLS